MVTVTESGLFRTRFDGSLAYPFLILFGAWITALWDWRFRLSFSWRSS